MKKLIFAMSIFSVIGSTAYADDTEIFTGAQTSGGGLNAILLLDTSGSMSQLEEIAGFEDYNPNKNYTGSDYGFDKDGYYLFRSDAIGDLLNLSSDRVSRIKEYKIDISQYNCKSSSVISNVDNYGYSTGRFAFFSTDRGWTAPGSSGDLLGTNPPAVNNNSGSIIQCKEADSWGYNDYIYQGQGFEDLSNFQHYNNSGAAYTKPSGFFDWGYSNRVYNWPSGYNIILSGNYLNYNGLKGASGNPNPSYKMRLDIVADAAKQVIASSEDPNFNISLMRFDSAGHGAFVGVPLSPAIEVADTFAEEIDSYDPAGGTPITESLWEAYLYLSEQDVRFGNDAYSYSIANNKLYRQFSNGATDADNQTFTTNVGNISPYGQYPTNYSNNSTYYSYTQVNSDSGSRDSSGSRYQLPDPGECGIPDQKIILFSDGAASGDDEVNGDVHTLLGTLSSLPEGLDGNCSGDGQCADELAYFLASKERQTKYGTPKLTIDTMGGFLNGDENAESTLIAIKDRGNGKYYPVSSEEDVVLAMAEATSQPVESPSTFTAPAIAVSSYNSLQISDELYYAVFEPNETGAWAGNLKRYRISPTGVVDSGSNVAVGSDGYFVSTATSFWSENADGANVKSGGAAERFIDQPRNIKLIDQSGGLLQATPQAVMNLSGDLLGLDAAGLTGTIFDTVNNVTYELGLANWISGLTPDGSANRQEMEDAIHSRPVVINYSGDKRVVYVGTNSGYLHAFDTANGREVFSIMPQEVLTNAKLYMDPEDTSALNKIYGLDGPISYWHNDSNLNGIVDDSDTVYLYVPMRRGGHSYYAFDVTNPDNPKVLWQKHGPYINSDKNVPSVSSGFSRLGQTWSSLKPALVNWQGTKGVYLFAGGGYDPAEDTSATSRLNHSVGNTIYMINPKTGDVVWNAYSDVAGASSNMTNSFPSDVTPIDRDGDGTVDLLYAADTGGRIWRFDAKDDHTGFTGGVIADLNNSATDGATENRRFFVRPDVSFINTTKTTEKVLADGSTVVVTTKDSFVLVSIGSGYRAHPLDETVNDHFYLIKDPHGLDYPEAYTKIGLSDLVDWTSTEATNTDKNGYGWYFDPLISGEKIMSPSITLNGVVTFNTFSKNTSDEVSCTGNLGYSRTYQLAVSEDIRNRVECADGSDSCKPDIPGSTPESDDEVNRLKPDPTIVMPEPEPDCPAGQVCVDPNCEDYAISILSGTTMTQGNMDRCDLFEVNYWEEEL